MNKFAIVLDSAADLPAALVEKYDLRVVPLHVAFGTTEHADGVDIKIEEFLDKLEAAENLPITSQPAPADFLDAYNALADEGYTEILSIHLSAALSGTYETARAAAAHVAKQRGIRIEAFDSCSATVGQGAMVLEAACIACAGGTLDEALERIANVRRTHRIYFIPDSLANLVKGGRASKFQGMATSLLNLKIVVTLTETGAIEVLHKAKGMKNAVSSPARWARLCTTSFIPRPIKRLNSWIGRSIRPMPRCVSLPWGPLARPSPRTWGFVPWDSLRTRRSSIILSSTISPST